MPDFTRGLDEVGDAIVGETEDEGVEAELVFQLERTAEATLAGSVRGEVGQ